MIFRACAIIPSRNHSDALPAVVARLRALDLPVFVLDDGSDPPHAAAIAAMHDPAAGVTVRRLEVNQGKGAAVLTAMRVAADEGFTHALQVDADGQHDLDRAADLIALALAEPGALISGAPIYDASAPLGRRIGRWITHVWVFIETLSFAIKDSMCGFRVYPIGPSLALANSETIGSRMDFDTEIMVRLFWRGVRPVMVPVRVVYPPGNSSNFRMLQDNVRITVMHTRLFFGMLARLPRLLFRGRQRAAGGTHWAGLAERGLLAGLMFSGGIYRLFGRRACMSVLVPVVLYFWLTGAEQRNASADYLARVLGRRATCWESFRHFRDFAARGLDMVAAWTGALPEGAAPSSGKAFEAMLAQGTGGVLVVSHHGNVEVARALADPALRDRLTVLVHTRHAENFNRVLRGFRPDVAARMLQVTELGPDTAIALKERVERGEWVAIAGDRVPVLSRDRVVRTDFLGAPASFAQGPWILAALLDCPVWTLFCWRDGAGHWGMELEPLFDKVVLPRGNRVGAITSCAAAYAERLQRHCRAYPWQWYNFFDFWAAE